MIRGTLIVKRELRAFFGTKELGSGEESRHVRKKGNQP